MGRIRTIKPELFRHAGLFDAEMACGLPLRVAFAGLFTVADRSGRFKWRPRQLKLDVLPYDNVDFSDVLGELARHGFILRYEVGGEAFGCIPTWEKHQVINNRETASQLPALPADVCPTCAPHVTDARLTPLGHAQEEGEGEGEGKGKLKPSASSSASPATDPPGFSEFWAAWPHTARKVDRKKCVAKWKAAKLAHHLQVILSHIGAMKLTQQWIDGYEPAPMKYLNGERWKDGPPPAAHHQGPGGSRLPALDCEEQIR